MEGGSLADKLNKLKEDIAVGEDRLVECQIQIKDTISERETMSDQIQDLNRKIKVKVMELQRRQGLLNTLQEKNKSTEREKVRLSEINRSISLDMTIEELTDNIQILKTEKADLESKMQEVSNKKKNVQLNLSKAQDKLSRLIASINSVNAKLNDTNSKLNNYDSNEGPNEDELYNTTKQLDAIFLEETVKTESYQRSYANVNKQRSKLRASLEKSKIELEAIEKEICAINELV